MTAAKRLKVTQVRSAIGFDKSHAQALRGLGLRRIRHTVDVEDTPSIRGLILKVRHLVDVEEAGAGTAGAARGRS
jgi:large subunit ribosomal protein L30